MDSTDKHKSSTGTSTGTCTDDTKPKTKETERDPLPEFMTDEMRETISHTQLDDHHLARIRKYLRDSETACDDQHQFNPSEFDMQNCMRINLKAGREAPPPEFRKQGHHMLEIIAAQIKESMNPFYRGGGFIDRRH